MHYSLMEKMKLLFIDSYLLCRGTLNAGLTIISVVKTEHRATMLLTTLRMVCCRCGLCKII